MHLWPASIPYWECFRELVSQRASAMGIGAIRYEVVIAWLDENGIDDPEDRQDYICILRSMDNVFRGLKDGARTEGHPQGRR